MARRKLILGDCLEVMKSLPDNSVDAVITDPPYHRVKNEVWDRQWRTDADYLAWLGRVADEWRRVLKANGSLYCFASPRMAARVEVMLGERFNVLNRITWQKDAGWARRQCKEEQRAFFPASEAIIFAEHYGADSVARGEAGYAAKCEELRGFVFEPLRAYLDGERRRAKWRIEDIAIEWMKWKGRSSKWVTRLAGHWFEKVQWMLPTEANYQWIRTLFNGDDGNDYLRREYEDLRREYEDLRREYEDLRREYEDLRRPFSVSADVPYTDVWTFPTVPHKRGKHPCQKPLAMMRHMVQASTRPDSIVLDPFMGSGTTGVAAMLSGRDFIGVEIDPGYFEVATRRIKAAKRDYDRQLVHWGK